MLEWFFILHRFKLGIDPYFHAVASQQRRVNYITSVMDGSNEVTHHSFKAKTFFDYFCRLIGSQGETLQNFNFDDFYNEDCLSLSEINALMQSWTDQDIRRAVSSWKSNKSPGPDGFTGEFYNTFIDILLPDLKAVFTYINMQPHATLQPLNNSFIVLIPKKESSTTPNDFRPISLVNGIQKIYSKIMAAQLKPLLEKLLSQNQTCFLKQRSILHGFHYAQQTIQAATKQRVQIAIFKADIYKAFDTLDWNFLTSILKARGLLHNWVQRVQWNVLQGRSRIILNSIAGKSINLKRGVRQGDSIFPYLFNLTMDFLAKWMDKLVDLSFLTPPFSQCKPCLLYADDTLVLLKPHASQILKVKLLFDIFGYLSGLKINVQKSKLVVNHAQLSLTQALADTIECKPAIFPIKYLGLPLSDKRLKRIDYMPLIEKIRAVLDS